MPVGLMEAWDVEHALGVHTYQHAMEEWSMHVSDPLIFTVWVNAASHSSSLVKGNGCWIFLSVRRSSVSYLANSTSSMEELQEPQCCPRSMVWQWRLWWLFPRYRSCLVRRAVSPFRACILRCGCDMQGGVGWSHWQLLKKGNHYPRCLFVLWATVALNTSQWEHLKVSLKTVFLIPWFILP